MWCNPLLSNEQIAAAALVDMGTSQQSLTLSPIHQVNPLNFGRYGGVRGSILSALLHIHLCCSVSVGLIQWEWQWAVRKYLSPVQETSFKLIQIPNSLMLCIDLSAFFWLCHHCVRATEESSMAGYKLLQIKCFKITCKLNCDNLKMTKSRVKLRTEQCDLFLLAAQIQITSYAECLRMLTHEPDAGTTSSTTVQWD